MKTIALVACVKTKRSGCWPAKDLYCSPLFKLSRQYAERNANNWYILSAKYGLVAPNDKIKYYEQTLQGASICFKRNWAFKVYEQMRIVGLLNGGIKILWLAGQVYQKELNKLLCNIPMCDPLEGKKFGKRISWLIEQLK